ncbi:MAG: hypothetical protein Q9160_005490 [Pyrenula sp. 1 TL-2023]
MDLKPRPHHIHFESDGPGHLSQKGARHDNDLVHVQNIQILPTTNEILAVDRPPYIPKKNLSHPHHLGHGPARLLDTLFRQLRYDSTEGLRDCCYTAAQYMASDEPTLTDNQTRQETASGRRFYLYNRAKIERTFADERKGLITQISFDCPKSLRKEKMTKSGRLEEGMLCALVSLKADGTPHFVFFEIFLRQTTFAMDSQGGNGLRAAVQVSFAMKDNREDLLYILRHLQDPDLAQFALIEFPGALYAGFYWHLKKLQHLRGTDIAFSSTIAPYPSLMSKKRDVPKHLLLPCYMLRGQYEVDLTPITNLDIKVPPQAMQKGSREGTLQRLRDNSSLDDGQAVALCDALTNEIAFVQGPPGTGKTYLGVAILRTLLASRPRNNHAKPILVVCLTNHALDSFLEGLVKAGIDRIARLGGNSRADWTKKYLLNTLARKTRPDEADSTERKFAELSRKELFNDINGLASALTDQKKTGEPSWYALKDYLEEHLPTMYAQLMTDIDSAQAQSFAFQYWAGGGDLKNLEELHDELRNALYPQADGSPDANELDAALTKIHWHAEQKSKDAQTNVWRLPLKQRKDLLREWSAEVDYDELAQKLIDLQVDHYKADNRVSQARQKIEAQCLAKRDVIGMTTTACARNWSLLRQLDIETVLCEEAGEVMEAHTLCSLFPSVEHAIFIGDPLQLRPQVEERLLQTEMNDRPDYRLDESLFEKFMAPRDPDLNPIPTSRLNIQRRMHPDIAGITRLTYPDLLDHSLTQAHPPTDGLEERMFWFDHGWPETSPEDSSTKSYYNEFEADMIFGMVKYLLRGGAYELRDIVILTPYKGQLALLKKKLSTVCSVWLHPKDRQTLIDDGLLEETSDQEREQLAPSDLLRLSTVDNFQGEEAKIIGLSTVRSSGPGFLRTANRINVMCSRARDGFYVFGNAEALYHVPMWAAILEVFGSRRGKTLMTRCTRHPYHRWAVTEPGDFDKVEDCPALARNVTIRAAIDARTCVVKNAGKAATWSSVKSGLSVAITLTSSAQVLPGNACNPLMRSKPLADIRSKSSAPKRMNHFSATSNAADNFPVVTIVLETALNALLLGDICPARLCAAACWPVDTPAPLNVIQVSLNALHVLNHVRDHARMEPVKMSAAKNVTLVCGRIKNCLQCLNGEETKQTYICLQPCGHVINAQDLDAHFLAGIYEISSEGVIEGLQAEPIVTNTKCPTCSKMIFGGRRYAVVDQLEHALDNEDRLILKMGRKLNMCASAIHHTEQNLQLQFEDLKNSIRPNPLAANRNRNVIQERSQQLREVIGQIIDMQENMALPFQISVSTLHPLLGSQYIKGNTIPFVLRFGLLLARARISWIQDNLQVADFLSSLKDSSEELPRMAVLLREDSIKPCVEGTGMCLDAIASSKDCQFPAMEAEFHILFVLFRYLETVCTALSKDVSALSEAFDSIVNEEMFEHIEAATYLCKHYPRTTGRFMPAVDELSSFLKGPRTTKLPTSFHTKKTRETEQLWGEHKVGYLTACLAGHPYSQETFKNCPECEEYVLDVEQQTKASQKFLFEQDFLAKMRMK